MSPEVHAAIIAAGASVIVSIFNLIHNCIQAKKNKNFQEKVTDIIQNKEDQRTKMQFDANIVWAARVEWIQNVRNLTAEFITNLNKFMFSEDNITRKKYLELIHAKSNLLILYFGPDKQSNTKVDLFDQTSNISKNEHIVKLIENINDNASAYFWRKSEIENYQNSTSLCQNCKASSDIYENCDFINNTMSEDEVKKSCNNHIDNCSNKINDLRQENQAFKDSIQDFTKIMRIYLKLEWNRAKDWNKEES